MTTCNDLSGLVFSNSILENFVVSAVDRSDATEASYFRGGQIYLPDVLSRNDRSSP